MDNQIVTQTDGGTNEADLQRRAVEAKLGSASMWEIISIFMRSPSYSRLTLDDLRWALLPAVTNKQFMVVHAQLKDKSTIVPIGVVLWASVSDEIDQFMQANVGKQVRLTSEQRRSGAHHWITDAIGDAPAIEAALKRLRDTTFQGQPLKTLVQATPATL